MKSKSMMSYVALTLSVIFLNAGCQKEIEAPVVAEKEIEKVTSVKTYPGRNRVKLWWKLPADERVVKSKVTWNDGSQFKDVPVIAGKDTLSVLIDNLAEGNYTFALYALDKAEKQSGKVIVNAKAYGQEFEAALENRVIKKVKFNTATSAAEIEWEPAALGVVGAEVKYTDAAAATHTVFLPPFSRNITLDNFKAGESFMYRTMHVPNSSAIDTFYTAFATVPVEQSTEEEPSPTTGWTLTPYTYNLQTPWTLPQSDRYSFANEEHRFWIFKGDDCHYDGCGTGPRSEFRMKNDYLLGKHQFEGDVFIVAGTSGTDIMQVFGGVQHSTSIMLKVNSANNGTIKRYDNETLLTNAYERWIHVNVQHDADNGKIYVYLDNQLKGVFDDRGEKTHYFKCGVYNISGTRSESRWKNIKYWKNGPVGK